MQQHAKTLNHTPESVDSVAQVVADWAAGLKTGQIPPEAEKACVETVIDTMGLAISARNEPYVEALRRSWTQSGPCTVLGTKGGFDAYTAAVINGTAGHGEDYDNTFEGCPVHSGVVAVPALFAVAEEHKLSGADVLKGIAISMELMCRLGLIANKSVHSAGFHPTAVLGIMATTAGVGSALGMDARQIRNALGVAGSLASGIIEYLADGTWTKRLHPGWSAQSAIRAALMGRAGFAGPATVFEGTHGFFSSFASSLKDPDFSILTDDLGQRWESANVAYKPYACGTMTQPYIDCAIRLAERGIKPEDIEKMVCKVGEGTVHRLWEPLADKHRPPTAYAAKFSSPYCMAVGLVCKAAGLAQFTDEMVKNEDVLAVARKISYEVDPQNEYPKNFTGHIRAHLRDGSVVEEFQPHMRGGKHSPLSREELVQKCAANLDFVGWDKAIAREIETFAVGIKTSKGPFSAARFQAPN